jgi:hypothetical protein
MDPSTLAQNVVVASQMLRRESDTERSCTDTYHITPKNTLLGRRSIGRKGWSRGLAKRSQTRAAVSRSLVLFPILQTLHRVSLHRHPNSPKSPTMISPGRCPLISRIRTLRNHYLLRVVHSSYRLRLVRVTVPPTQFNIFRQRRDRSPL